MTINLPQFVYVYVARIFPGAANFLIAVLMFQWLDLNDYASFSFFFLLLIALPSLCYGWINQSVIRFSNGAEDYVTGDTGLFSTAIYVATIPLALAIFVISYFGYTSSYVGLCLLAACIAQGFHAFASAVHQSKFRLKQYVSSEICRAVLILGSVAGSAIVTQSVETVILSITAALYAHLIFLYFQSKGFFSLFAFSLRAENIERGKTILTYSWSASVFLGLLMLWPALDRILIDHLFDSQVVGIYAAHYDLVYRAFVFALLPLTLVAQPRIFKAYADGRFVEISRTIKRTIVLQLIVSMLFTLIYFSVSAFASPWIAILRNLDLSLFLPMCLAATVWQIALVVHKPLECTRKLPLLLAALIASIAICYCFILLTFASLGVFSFPIGIAVAGFGYCLICYLTDREIYVKGRA